MCERIWSELESEFGVNVWMVDGWGKRKDVEEKREDGGARNIDEGTREHGDKGTRDKGQGDQQARLEQLVLFGSLPLFRNECAQCALSVLALCSTAEKKRAVVSDHRIEDSGEW